MKLKLFSVALAQVLFLAADKFQPLDAKLGLWEITTVQQMSGVPPIPPEMLARLTPEQHAKFEAAYKQRAARGPSSQTRQTCMTQDKLNRAPFSDDKKSCQRTIVASTSTMAQFREECTEPDGTRRTMEGKFELAGSSAMKGSIQVKASANNKTMNINVDLSGKWLSSDCGSVKPD